MIATLELLGLKHFAEQRVIGPTGLGFVLDNAHLHLRRAEVLKEPNYHPADPHGNAEKRDEHGQGGDHNPIPGHVKHSGRFLPLPPLSTSFSTPLSGRKSSRPTRTTRPCGRRWARGAACT